mgnify:CR=1 FL=1
MKPPRERAIDVMYQLFGFGFSRDVFATMVQDKSERGQTLREWVVVIEAGIERDRAEVAKGLGPS